MTFPKIAQRLIDFVLHDQQFKQLGVRGGADAAFREIYGREPLKEVVGQVVRDFWQVWHENFANPRSLPPAGVGSPYYTLQELFRGKRMQSERWRKAARQSQVLRLTRHHDISGVRDLAV